MQTSCTSQRWHYVSNQFLLWVLWFALVQFPQALGSPQLTQLRGFLFGSSSVTIVTIGGLLSTLSSSSSAALLAHVLSSVKLSSVICQPFLTFVNHSSSYVSIIDLQQHTVHSTVKFYVILLVAFHTESWLLGVAVICPKWQPLSVCVDCPCHIYSTFAGHHTWHSFVVKKLCTVFAAVHFLLCTQHQGNSVYSHSEYYKLFCMRATYCDLCSG